MAVTTRMTPARVLNRAIERHDANQAVIARSTGKSPTTISQVVNGKREASMDLLLKTAEALDDPVFAYDLMEAIPQLARYRTANLCEERVDLAPVTVAAKLLEELREAIEPADTLRQVLTNKPRNRNPNVFSVEEEQRLYRSLMQILDLEPAIRALVASLDRCHGIRAARVYEAHRQKLIDAGYVGG